MLVLVDVQTELTRTLRIWSLLIHSPYCLNVTYFINQYQMTFQSNITISKLEQLTSVVKVIFGFCFNSLIINVFQLINNNGERTIQLTSFYIMAAQIYQIIYKAGGQILFSNLNNLYKKTFGKALIPADYDFNSLEDLLSSLSFLILIRGGRKKMSLILNRKLNGLFLKKFCEVQMRYFFLF